MAELVIFKNKQELERLESTISRNMKAFYEVGCALAEIRDKGYYKDVLGFSTFEEYCKVKWDFGRAHAYRLIDSASVVDIVSPNGIQKPTSERQARPLTRLEPEQQRNVWEKVVEIAPEGKITASLVSKITKRMFPMAKNKKPTEITPNLGDMSEAAYFVEIALSHLRRIRDDDPLRVAQLERLEEWITNNKKELIKCKR